MWCTSKAGMTSSCPLSDIWGPGVPSTNCEWSSGSSNSTHSLILSSNASPASVLSGRHTSLARGRRAGKTEAALWRRRLFAGRRILEHEFPVPHHILVERHILRIVDFAPLAIGAESADGEMLSG